MPKASGRPDEAEQLLIPRLRLRLDDLRSLHRVAHLPWAYSIAGDGALINGEGQVVAYVQPWAVRSPANTARYLLDAVNVLPFIFAAEEYGLTFTVPRVLPDPHLLALAAVGEAALAADAARLAVIAHDAESDHLYDNPASAAHEGTERERHKFWLARGEARGRLVRAMEDAAMGLARAAATYRAAHPEKAERSDERASDTTGWGGPLDGGDTDTQQL